MGVIIKQLDGSIVSPKDDAILYKTFNSEDGVIRGCEITHMGSNQIKVGEGYVYLCGRMVEIEEETVLSPFAEKSAAGELVLKIDLLSDTPAKLVARTPRAELTKEDINAGGSVYEFLMASYKVSDITISELKIEYGYTMAGFPKDKVLKTLEQINGTTKEGFLPDVLAIKELNKKVISAQGRAEEAFRLGTSTKSQIISSLKNSGLGLTVNSSWDAIIGGLRMLFPDTLDVLAYSYNNKLYTASAEVGNDDPGASISVHANKVSGTWGRNNVHEIGVDWNSGQFSLNGFKTLSMVSSFTHGSLTLQTSGGNVSVASGTKNIDVSAYTGNASLVFRSRVQYAEGSVSITKALLSV